MMDERWRAPLVPDTDLKVEPWSPRPPGGQQVGVATGVRVTHLPTGLEAVCNTDRSQHRNKRIAVQMIEAALTSPDFRG